MTRRSTSSITPSVFFALLGITLILCGPAWAQSTTIRGGGGGDTAQVTNGELHVTGAFTVEGAAGGTSQADDSAVTTITGIGALYDTTPPAITDGRVGLPVMNSSRQLIVDCPNCTGGSGGTQYAEDTAHSSGDLGTMLLGVRNDTSSSLSSNDGDYTPVRVTSTGAVATALTQINNTLVSAGNGSSGNGVQRVTLADDSTGVLASIGSITNPVAVTGTFWQATQPVSLASVPSHAVTNAGTFAVQAAQSGTWTVQPGNTANTTAWLTSPRPSTSGGLAAPCRTISAASTNATSCKASAGQLYGWSFSNTNAEERYLKIYNKASAPTVGTDTPIQTILIPGATTGAGNNWASDMGIPYSTGIAYAITTGPTDADTGAVAANEIIVHLYYK